MSPARTTCATRWPRPPARWPPACRSTRSCAASKRSRRSSGRLQRKQAVGTRARATLIDDTLQRQSRLGARRDRRAGRTRRRRACWCWATWAKSATHGPAVSRRDRRLRATSAASSAVRAGRRWRDAARRSAQARVTSPMSAALIAAVQQPLPALRQRVLVKGSRFMQDGARGRDVTSLGRARRTGTAALNAATALAQWLRTDSASSASSVHHLPCGAGRA